MIALKKQVVTALSVGTMLLATAAPAAFADVAVSGNGAFSDNNVRVSQNNSASLSQRNTTNVSNNVNVRGNTGNNNASFNTGGNTDIQTGSTFADVSIRNTAGQNIAELGGLSSCGCQTLGDVFVSGNGAKSNNRVSEISRNTLRINQNNNTNFRNNVSVSGNTGNNRSSFNTGGQTRLIHGKGNFWNWDGGNNSSNEISTGDTGASVMIDNMAGSNQLGL